jgi:hypothetical protein
MVAATAFVAAIYVPTVTVLFGLIGALCASLFGFILPALLAMNFEEVWQAKDQHHALGTITRFLTVVLLVTGCFCAIVGTYFSIPS